VIDATILRALAAAGATTEMIIAAVEAAQAADEARKEAKRAGNAERQQRFRDRRKTRKAERNDSNALRDVTPPIEDHTPHSVISPDGEKQNKPRKQRGSAGVRPDDIPEELWEAWSAHRAKHRADTGPTTIAAYRREAADVGWTLEQALTEQISRGWRGFKAKWVKEDDRPAPRLQPANDFRSVRGSRPNPALDMVLEAERELQAEALRQNPGVDWPPRASLPSC